MGVILNKTNEILRSYLLYIKDQLYIKSIPEIVVYRSWVLESPINRNIINDPNSLKKFSKTIESSSELLTIYVGDLPEGVNVLHGPNTAFYGYYQLYGKHPNVAYISSKLLEDNPEEFSIYFISLYLSSFSRPIQDYKPLEDITSYIKIVNNEVS